MKGDLYDLNVQAKALWIDTSEKDAQRIHREVTPEDVPEAFKRMVSESVAEVLNTKAKTSPGEIRVWHSTIAKYADGRTAKRMGWLDGHESAADALRASEDWVVSNLKVLIEIGSDEI